MIFPYKKALITGCAGFIGSHLVNRLLEFPDVDVIGIDDLSAGKFNNMQSFINNDRFQFYNVDITKKRDLWKLFNDNNFDIIFHQAASKKTVCLKDPMRDLEVNAEGTFNLLELSEDFGIEKFIHASTGSVYGEGTGEEQYEDYHINPTSFYGISKFAGERYVQLFHKNYLLNTTILRYVHVYGERQEDNQYGGVIAIFSKKILEENPLTVFGDGDQIRQFTYVGDVVEANILSAIQKISTGKIYNVNSDVSISLNKMIRILKNLTNKSANIIYGKEQQGDIYNFNIRNDKIKKELGIKFIGFREGLKRTLAGRQR